MYVQQFKTISWVLSLTVPGYDYVKIYVLIAAFSLFVVVVSACVCRL